MTVVLPKSAPNASLPTPVKKKKKEKGQARATLKTRLKKDKRMPEKTDKTPCKKDSQGCGSLCFVWDGFFFCVCVGWGWRLGVEEASWTWGRGVG